MGMKGKDMFAIVFFLLGCVVTLVFKEWKRDESKSDMAFVAAGEARAMALNASQLAQANSISVSRSHEKFETVLALSEELSSECDRYAVRFKDLDEICYKLRKHVITLQDKVSQRSPVINLQTIPVQVIEKGQGVKALITK